MTDAEIMAILQEIRAELELIRRTQDNLIEKLLDEIIEFRAPESKDILKQLLQKNKENN